VYCWAPPLLIAVKFRPVIAASRELLLGLRGRTFTEIAIAAPLTGQILDAKQSQKEAWAKERRQAKWREFRMSAKENAAKPLSKATQKE